MILKEENLPVPWNIFKESANRLLKAANNISSSEIQSILKQILPSYSPGYFDPLLEKEKVNYTIKGEA